MLVVLLLKSYTQMCDKTTVESTSNLLAKGKHRDEDLGEAVLYPQRIRHKGKFLHNKKKPYLLWDWTGERREELCCGMIPAEGRYVMKVGFQMAWTLLNQSKYSRTGNVLSRRAGRVPISWHISWYFTHDSNFVLVVILTLIKKRW